MQSLRSAFSRFILFGLTLFAIATVPDVAYAEVIDVADSVYFGVYNYQHPNNPSLTSGDFYNWMRSNVNGVVAGNSYTAGYLMPMNREIDSTTYGSQSSTSVSTITNSQPHLVTHYTIPDMSSWVSNPVGCLFINRDKAVMPAGSRLIISSMTGRIEFHALNGTGNDTWAYLTPDNINVWVSNGTSASGKVLAPYNKNVNAYVTTIEAKYIWVTFRLQGTPRGSDVLVEIPFDFHLYLDLEGTYTEQIIQNQNQNTQTVMNTEGSNGVVDGVSSQGQQMVNRLGFVSQTASFVTQTVGVIANGDAQDGVTFPGLSWDGQTLIAQQSVNILGWLGTDVENAVRAFCTMLVFLAWLAGLRGMYHKIFLGETEVEVVSE